MHLRQILNGEQIYICIEKSELCKIETPLPMREPATDFLGLMRCMHATLCAPPPLHAVRECGTKPEPAMKIVGSCKPPLQTRQAWVGIKCNLVVSEDFICHQFSYSFLEVNVFRFPCYL